MKKFIMLVLLIGLAMFAAACGDSGNNDEAEGNDTSGANNGSSEETASTITVEHELGETEVEVNPEKVVVFDLGILDALDQLDIDVVGLPKSVIPGYLNKYESDDYANVGSLHEPDFEKLAEIDPDLIIISGRASASYDQLSELAPTVFLGVDATRYIDSFKENMHTLGKIFDREADIEEALASIDASVEELNKKAQAADKKGLIILANDDKISAYGPNSRFGLIHDVFGVPASDENIDASTHGMNVSFEYVMEQNPDKLYVIDRSAAINDGSSAEQIVENKLVKNTTAFKEDQIYYLSADVWYLAGGGLQSVQQMVDEIAASYE
ncbi:siderophore ABC transporter substrate-binding protein [Lentibacillus saliphilus]|uniref:siderophore ABC transporter substrate-binding protein n=1 Tax=Lentibacillus saliphilus TaxID=2737028 RepID=UPI001C3099CE|nr:siderophore ABC transporter substrate-binding protein [Lentibacillus saliphilus]